MVPFCAPAGESITVACLSSPFSAPLDASSLWRVSHVYLYYTHTCRSPSQVHPHRNGKVFVSLTRADFMSLVSSCAAQYSYKISPSSEELKVACRSVSGSY